VAIGMAIVGATYLLARQLGLTLTTTVFQGFFAIILIAIVIIFQEEIKHFLEQIASRSHVSGSRGKGMLDTGQVPVGALVEAARNLARERIGALIVLRGRDPIVRHLDGGIELGGNVSEQVLRSLFDPHSPGHDGALVIEGNRITVFSTHLPLSKNFSKLKHSGTRHAAALGLAELTDAMCLVISEEEGTISVARTGDIRLVRDAEELSALFEQFYREVTPRGGKRSWTEFFKRNYKEKAIAVSVTIFLWFFFVHESRIEYRSYVVPVEYGNLPVGMVVQRIEPQEVEVTFSGPKRSFYFVSPERIKVLVKLFDVRRGMIRRDITKSNITFPEGLSMENVQPHQVMVVVRTGGETPRQGPASGEQRQ
jgi:diadenylate cyclase